MKFFDGEIGENKYTRNKTTDTCYSNWIYNSALSYFNRCLNVTDFDTWRIKKEWELKVAELVKYKLQTGKCFSSCCGFKSGQPLLKSPQYSHLLYNESTVNLYFWWSLIPLIINDLNLILDDTKAWSVCRVLDWSCKTRL